MNNVTSGIPKPVVIDPKGWKGTIGLIIPSVHTTHPEHESRYLLPEGVGLICQRVLGDPKLPYVEALHQMHSQVPAAAYLLSTAEVNVISFGCTGSSFIEGRQFELHLVEEMEKASSLPAVTVAGAIADAIRFLDLHRVLVISPYPPEGTQLLEKYLKEEQSIGIHSMHMVPFKDVTLTPWQQFKVVLEACRAAPPGADAIFFSCGATRIVEVIPTLEAELGIPVLSTNMCNIWKCLKLLKVRAAIQGQGKLFEVPR